MNVLKFKKGAMTTSTIIAAVIAVIVLVAVGVAVTADLVNNLTQPGLNGSVVVPGTAGTILNLLPLFFGLATIVFVASAMLLKNN